MSYLGPAICSYKANSLLAHFEVFIERGPILDEAEQSAAVGRGYNQLNSTTYRFEVKNHTPERHP